MNSPILSIPREIPVIVLNQTVFFPHSLLPLHIFEDRYRIMLRHALNDSRIVGVAQFSEEPEAAVPDLARVMGIGVVRACVEKPDGTSDLILQGLARVQITGEMQHRPFRILDTEKLLTLTGDHLRCDAIMEKIKEHSDNLVQQGYRMPVQLSQYWDSGQDPEIICDILASHLVESAATRQKILEAADLEVRLGILLPEMENLVSTI